MKRVLFILIFISTNTFSQNYIPFPDSGATWVNVTKQVNPFPIPMCEFWYATNYCVNGEDTLINATNYTKVEICQVGSYEGAIRDDNGKVYYVPEDSTAEILLYDFTLDSGDTVYEGKWQVPWDMEITQIDSVLIFGEYHKKIQLEGAIWIEGIGNVNGLFSENISNISGVCYELGCFSINDSTKYPNETLESCYLGVGLNEKEHFQFNVFPNPNETGKLQINHNSIESISYSLIDLQGKLIEQGELIGSDIELPDKQGIYILKLQGSFGVRSERIIVN